MPVSVAMEVIIMVQHTLHAMRIQQKRKIPIRRGWDNDEVPHDIYYTIL